MKKWMIGTLGWLCFAGLTVGLRAADEVFSRTVGTSDFSAAGLTKLSPEELARLDALVRDYKSGALLAAQRQAAAAAQAQAAAEAKAAKAEADRQAAATAAAQAAAATPAKTEATAEQKPGFFARAKAVLTPGTEVEYSTVESRIKGDFTGWNSHTVFTLENGQRWQVANPSSYYTPVMPGPKVKIEPSSFGGFWMTFEGVNERVKVKPFGVN